MSEPSTEAGDARTARWGTRALACCVCGAAPRDPSAAADLATPWLLRDPDGAVVARRYCRGCAPRGPVGEIACVMCGDGPLLAGELAGDDLLTGAAVDDWLLSSGWRPAGPWCPDCDPDRRRRPGRDASRSA